MKTIYELQTSAARLRAMTEAGSISPEETFGLVAEVLEYLAGMEQNVHGLGIHQIYASVVAMNAATEPTGSDGKILRFGQLVAVYDPANAQQTANGNIYAWQGAESGTKWKLMGNISDVGAMLQRMSQEEGIRQHTDEQLQYYVEEIQHALQEDSEWIGRIDAAIGLETENRRQADESLQETISALLLDIQAAVSRIRQLETAASTAAIEQQQIDVAIGAETEARRQADESLQGTISELLLDIQDAVSRIRQLETAASTAATERRQMGTRQGENDADNLAHHNVRFSGIVDDVTTLGDPPQGWMSTAADYRNTFYSSVLECFCTLLWDRSEGRFYLFDAGSLWNDPTTGHPYMEKVYLWNGEGYVYTGDRLRSLGEESKKVYLTQAEYDALVAAGTVADNVEYNIYEED